MRRTRLVLEQLEDRCTPATLRVGAGETYATIQSAVNAAHSGDLVLIDAGVYTEQVHVAGPAKNNLTFLTLSSQAAVIQAPPGMTGNKAVFEILGSTGVTLNGLTITGPGSENSHSIEEGVLVSAGSTNVNIINCHITQIHDTFSPGQGTASINGWGVRVTDLLNTNVTQRNAATVLNDTIDNYQRAGVFAEGGTSTVSVVVCKITGIGPTNLLSQAGIDIENGAKATITSNTISGNQYLSVNPDDPFGQGVFLFQAGATTISSNTLTGNGNGVIAQNTNAAVIVQANTIRTSNFNGVALVNSSQVIVRQNTVTLNGNDGLFVDAASSKNTITNNTFTGNTHFDMEDLSVGAGTGGTANSYGGNTFATSNVPLA